MYWYLIVTRMWSVNRTLFSFFFLSFSPDASNKGNNRLFPLCVRYFTVKGGTGNKLLDFYESANETAHPIHDCVCRVMKENCRISG
jgi:hypothetical protein